MDTQKCTKCGEEKLLEEYNIDKTNKVTGRVRRCKKCVSSKMAEYYQKNKAARKAARKEQYEKHKEKIKERALEYYHKHKEEIKEKRKENPEKVRASNKKYREENKEKIKAQKQEYFQRVKGCPEYREKRQLAKQRRKARKLENGIEHFTTKQLKEHWAQEGIDPESCYYCKEGKREHVDHYVPLAKGGPHFMSNLRPSCAPCNHSKNDKDPEEWIASRL